MRLRAWQLFQNAIPARRHRRETASIECLELRVVPAVNITNAASFVVKITGNEAVQISADSSGKVVVTVDGVDSVQTTNSVEVTSLTITASGNFANRIDLQGVTQLDFGNLTDISVNGGSGNDVLIGSELTDTLFGGSGNDALLGLGGDDSLRGGGNADVVLGGTGNDSLDGGINNDTLSGEGGNDTCFGGFGADKISGGAGNDVLNGGDGTDSLTGDDGNDYVYGGTGKDTLSGGLGTDMVKGHGSKDVIQGSRDDVLAEAQAVRDALLADPSHIGTPQLPTDGDNEYSPLLVFNTSFVPDPNDYLSI